MIRYEVVTATLVAMNPKQTTTDKPRICKIKDHWYLMIRREDRLYIREFATHALALSTALWLLEVDMGVLAS